MKKKIDTISFSLHENGKSNKSREVKFIITITKNPNPSSLQTSAKWLKCVYTPPPPPPPSREGK